MTEPKKDYAYYMRQQALARLNALLLVGWDNSRAGYWSNVAELKTCLELLEQNQAYDPENDSEEIQAHNEKAKRKYRGW